MGIGSGCEEHSTALLATCAVSGALESVGHPGLRAQLKPAQYVPQPVMSPQWPGQWVAAKLLADSPQAAQPHAPLVNAGGRYFPVPWWGAHRWESDIYR